MGEVIAEIVALLLVVGVIYRWVVPPVRRMMRQRQDAVRKQIEDSRAAAAQLAAAEARYRDAIAAAKAEAAKIRDDARADAQHINAEMRAAAEREVERIRQRGEEQLARLHQQVVRELRAELGGQAVTLAERMVRESLADDRRRSRTVDAFLDELEGMGAPEQAGS